MSEIDPETGEVLEEGEEETPPETPPSSGGSPKGLREEKERWKKEALALRGQVMSGHLTSLGLTVDAGLGKAIAKEYEGDFTLEAITAYAKEEYGHEPTTRTEVVGAVITGDKIEALNSQGQSITPPPVVDEAGEITARMHDPESGRTEAVSSLNAKMQQFAQEHYPQGTQSAQ